MLGCFQRVLLYGGVVLSVGILVATMSGLWADYREHVSRQRASFLTARSMLNIELHAHQAAFARTVTSAKASGLLGVAVAGRAFMAAAWGIGLLITG